MIYSKFDNLNSTNSKSKIQHTTKFQLFVSHFEFRLGLIDNGGLRWR